MLQSSLTVNSTQEAIQQQHHIVILAKLRTPLSKQQGQGKLQIMVLKRITQVTTQVTEANAIEQNMLRCFGDAAVQASLAGGAVRRVGQLPLVHAGVELGSVEAQPGSEGSRDARVDPEICRQSRVVLDGEEVLAVVVDHGLEQLPLQELLGVELEALVVERGICPDATVHTKVTPLIKSKPASLDGHHKQAERERGEIATRLDTLNGQHLIPR